MCRFLVYKGSDEILLSKLILDPTHSILTQSFDSRLRLDMRRPHNGDGFGIGYYTDPKLGPEPCIFTSTTPAWNCINLQRIASKTASPLIFAHVRATTEGSLSDDNCHPFCHGSLMWMHNGGLGGWKHIKRRLGERLADKWYLGVQGGTDSEWAFALYLDTLERTGYNPSSPPAEGFGPTVLRQCMLKTIKQINDFIAEIPHSVVEGEKVDTRSLLNFAVTDGHSVVCTRYVSSRTDEAASLYYSSGTTWEDRSMKGEYQMDRRDKGADIVLVASEPLTFERESWVTVPTNSTLTIHKQTVMVHPIIDEYYNYNPYHSRSSKFVQDRGLITNEKSGGATPARGSSPAVTPNIPLPHQDKRLGNSYLGVSTRPEGNPLSSNSHSARPLSPPRARAISPTSTRTLSPSHGNRFNNSHLDNSTLSEGSVQNSSITLPARSYSPIPLSGHPSNDNLRFNHSNFPSVSPRSSPPTPSRSLTAPVGTLGFTPSPEKPRTNLLYSQQMSDLPEVSPPSSNRAPSRNTSNSTHSTSNSSHSPTELPAPNFQNLPFSFHPSNSVTDLRTISSIKDSISGAYKDSQPPAYSQDAYNPSPISKEISSPLREKSLPPFSPDSFGIHPALLKETESAREKGDKKKGRNVNMEEEGNVLPHVVDDRIGKGHEIEIGGEQIQREEQGPPPMRGAFGDPKKIAKFFPELKYEEKLRR